MHTVEGSRKINEDRNELLATSDLSLKDLMKTGNLVHTSMPATKSCLLFPCSPFPVIFDP